MDIDYWGKNRTGIGKWWQRPFFEANQGQDESVFAKPTSLLAFALGGGKLIFHFPYRTITELELMKSVHLTMVQQFGRELHGLQDSFSHMGLNPLRT